MLDDKMKSMTDKYERQLQKADSHASRQAKKLEDNIFNNPKEVKSAKIKVIQPKKVIKKDTKEFDLGDAVSAEDQDFISNGVFRYFGIHTPYQLGQEERSRVKYIHGFLSDSKNTTASKIMKALSQIERKIGSPRLGMSRIGHIYNYIKLKQQADISETEANIYATGGS